MAKRMLGRDDAAGEEVSRALLSGLDEAAAALEPGRHRSDVAIHEFRKAIKRHRALLRLTQTVRGEAAAVERREAGALARRLSGARDLTASREGLDDLIDKALIGSELAAPVRTALETARKAAEAAHLDAAIRADIEAFLARARAEAETVARADLPLRTLITTIAKGYRRMVKTAPADWSAASPESLHDLRKRVVIHRYQMELARPLWPRPIELWIEELQKLRDRLGENQDLEALVRFITAMPAGLDPRGRARLLAAVRTRQGQLIAAAEQQLTRLAAERPRAFASRLLAYASEQTLTAGNPAPPPAKTEKPDKAPARRPPGKGALGKGAVSKSALGKKGRKTT
jgi:CHAD domain-containing protein